MTHNNSPLRAYIKRALYAGLSKEIAWTVWKRVLFPVATKSVFDAEWKKCAKSHDDYNFTNETILRVRL